MAHVTDFVPADQVNYSVFQQTVQRHPLMYPVLLVVHWDKHGMALGNPPDPESKTQ